MRYVWIGAAILFAVAAAATWWAFQNPLFWQGFIAAAVASALNVLWPHLKLMLKPRTGEYKRNTDIARDMGLEVDPLTKKIKPRD